MFMTGVQKKCIMQRLQCSGIFCHIELNVAYDFVKLWFVGDQSSRDIAFLMIKIK